MKSALLVVYPAYGRTYASPEAMEIGFQQGRDFSPALRGGPYLSIRDFVKYASYDEAYNEVSSFTGVILTQLSPKGARVVFQVQVNREDMQWPPKI